MKDLTKNYAFQLNDETTIGIDYREFVTDYSDKAYKIEYKEYADNEGKRTAYIPKSVVDSDGNLPLWWVKEQTFFPGHSYFHPSEEELFQAEKKLQRFVETKESAKDPEKRKESIKRWEKNVEDLTAARNLVIANQIAKIVKQR